MVYKDLKAAALFPEPTILVSKVALGNRKHECFLCGDRYIEKTSTAPVPFNSMYCSIECQEQDNEEISSNLISEQEQQFKTTEQLQHDTTLARVKSLSGFDMRMAAAAKTKEE